MRSRKGFTLIEMIFVVGIIAVLAGFAIPRYLTVRRRAETVKLTELVQQTRVAVLSYESDNGGQSDNIEIGPDGSVPDVLAKYIGPNAFDGAPGGVRVSYTMVDGTPLGSPGRMVPTLVMRGNSSPEAEALLQQFLRDYQGTAGGSARSAVVVPLNLDGSGSFASGGSKGGGTGSGGAGGATTFQKSDSL